MNAYTPTGNEISIPLKLKYRVAYKGGHKSRTCNAGTKGKRGTQGTGVRRRAYATHIQKDW